MYDSNRLILVCVPLIVLSLLYSCTQGSVQDDRIYTPANDYGLAVPDMNVKLNRDLAISEDLDLIVNRDLDRSYDMTYAQDMSMLNDFSVSTDLGDSSDLHDYYVATDLEISNATPDFTIPDMRIERLASTLKIIYKDEEVVHHAIILNTGEDLQLEIQLTDANEQISEAIVYPELISNDSNLDSPTFSYRHEDKHLIVMDEEVNSALSFMLVIMVQTQSSGILIREVSVHINAQCGEASLIGETALNGLSSDEDMKSRSIISSSSSGDPLILMDLGKVMSSRIHTFRIFSRNDLSTTADFDISLPGLRSQAIPVALYHEANNIYGLVYTFVDAATQGSAQASNLIRFTWNPSDINHFNIISTMNWASIGNNSEIIHAVDDDTDLLILATRKAESHIPLVLVRLPKQLFADTTGTSIEFNDTTGEMTINNVPVAEQNIVSLAVSTDTDFDQTRVIWSYEAVSVFDAQISPPLTFMNDRKARVIVVGMGFNGPRIPRNNYRKVWTYIVYDHTQETIPPVSVEGYEIFPVSEPVHMNGWSAYELSLAKSATHENTLAILMSLGHLEGVGCDPSQIGIDGGMPGSSCPIGQRCRVIGGSLHQCRGYKGIYLGRALLKFNPDGSVQENPWEQVSPVAILNRNLQMYYDQGQTIVSWIEDDGIHPARVHIGEFSLDALLCQDGEGPCSPNYQLVTDMDMDGVSSTFDCNDHDENIGHFDMEGNVCVPYTSIYPSPASFVREFAWLADVLLLHDSSSMIMTQEGLNGPEKVRITDLNLCQ